MQNQPKPHRIRLLIVPFLWLGTLGLLYVNQQRVIDWWKLRDYSPSPDIVAIAQTARMNELGTHLFSVKSPQLMGAASFSKECPVPTKKTIILGCYKGGAGVFISTM